MKYNIYESRTGNLLIKSIELPEDQVENVSSDSAEGHFQANLIGELEELGTQSVYATLN